MSRTCVFCGAPQLTTHQLALLRHMADPEELTLEQIGARLGKAHQTIKNNATRLYVALGVKGRVGAVLKAGAMAGRP